MQRPASERSADRIDLPAAAQKADHPLGKLKRLDEAVEQNPVETAIAEADSILVVLVEGVYPPLLWSEVDSLITLTSG